jgi:hypothetical protein
VNPAESRTELAETSTPKGRRFRLAHVTVGCYSSLRIEDLAITGVVRFVTIPTPMIGWLRRALLERYDEAGRLRAETGVVRHAPSGSKRAQP